MKILGNYRFYWGGLMGAKPPAEKWAFISEKLIYRVGGKNKEK